MGEAVSQFPSDSHGNSQAWRCGKWVVRLVGRLSASGETDINTHANVDWDSSSVTSEILGDGPPRVIFYFWDGEQKKNHSEIERNENWLQSGKNQWVWQESVS